MKVTFKGYDPELGAKFLHDNAGLVVAVPTRTGQRPPFAEPAAALPAASGEELLDDEDEDEDYEEDEEEDEENEARQYLMDEGLPVTAQSLHDAAQFYRDEGRWPNQADPHSSGSPDQADDQGDDQAKTRRSR